MIRDTIAPALGRLALSAVLTIVVLSMISAGAGQTARTGAGSPAPMPADTVTRPMAPIPDAPLSLNDMHVIGSPGARVGLAIIFNYECSFCGTFARDILPKVKSLLVDRGHLVVALYHIRMKRYVHSDVTATIERCAADQNRFWPVFALMMQNPRGLRHFDMRSHAAQLGVNLPAFDRCVASAAETV